MAVTSVDRFNFRTRYLLVKDTGAIKLLVNKSIFSNTQRENESTKCLTPLIEKKANDLVVLNQVINRFRANFFL